MQQAGTPETLHLMVVESDAAVAAPILRSLNRHFGAGCACLCSTLDDAMQADVQALDMVICDMSLVDGSGINLLSDMLRRRPDLPFVLVTNKDAIEDAMRAIRSGAYDYVVKVGEYPDIMPLVVEKNLTIWQTKRDNLRLQETLTATLNEISIKNRQLEEAVTKLEAVAATDPLTRLANRRSFNQSLTRCMAEALRYGNDLACVMIDLDGFKQINDRLGHQRGDLLLQHTAQLIVTNSRNSDIVARYGGDEFVILLPQTNVEKALEVASRIGLTFGRSSRHLVGDATGECQQVSMSMGLTCVSITRPSSAEQLVAQADHALYRAKQSGRSRIVIYEAPSPHPEPVAGVSGKSSSARIIQFDI
jgi:diguanylate cyclase (GGDEF)-like protein